MSLLLLFVLWTLGTSTGSAVDGGVTLAFPLLVLLSFLAVLFRLEFGFDSSLEGIIHLFHL